MALRCPAAAAPDGAPCTGAVTCGGGAVAISASRGCGTTTWTGTMPSAGSGVVRPMAGCGSLPPAAGPGPATTRAGSTAWAIGAAVSVARGAVRFAGRIGVAGSVAITDPSSPIVCTGGDAVARVRQRAAARAG